MAEQKNEAPLVRLGDVAKWMRAGDRFHYRHSSGRDAECRITEVEKDWVYCTGEFTGVRFSQLVTLISPRLELVPVGAVVKVGVPYAYLDGSKWTDFEPPVKDFANPIGDCYQLTRDEPEQLPREVVAGPETLRAGDVVEFVRNEDGDDVGYMNSAGPYAVAERQTYTWCDGWRLMDTGYIAYDRYVMRLLSRANQDPPATVGPGGDYPSLAAAEAAGETRIEPVAPKQTGPTTCHDCGQPFSAWRPVRHYRGGLGWCGDCRGRAVAPIPWRELAEAAPDPHAHLTPAQRWHLDDDPDATGIPEGN